MYTTGLTTVKHAKSKEWIDWRT